MLTNVTKLVAAIVLALGFAAAGWLLGRSVLAMRLADRTVEVRGLAERDVKADLAVWPIRFVVTGDDLAAAEQQIRDGEATIRKFLESGGMTADAVSVQGFDVTDALAQIYRSGPVETRYVVMETLLVRSPEVDKVAALHQRSRELAAAGVALTSESAPAFVFTRLNDVKPEMIAEATRAARTAAQQFAQDAATRIGGIRRGNQGLFQILPRDDVPALPPERQIDKKLRVVSTIEFYLAD